MIYKYIYIYIYKETKTNIAIFMATKLQCLRSMALQFINKQVLR